ncbi:enkurin domain-containing protein 1 [Rhineura floridana]|uniref:enkurin domain-containing protein 1 n=1 Tax=Rhineura floridana TaxID=261503 RepID=UPI002AC7EDBD|nr:enkurin domain-containing protein 1 [Rhineura floridana]XP_061449650.1 enkurin domain-containing protein 1 [Rhineura floridana]XP_061449651.1 enkurin domain-containing protein 1 [Rhineura floridana]XP_061449652.1 enkurin domain-containing protein 1 [Rhineura floridana]
MSEGPSRITGPIPPDPSLCPDYYRRPLSARGRLEGNSLKLDLLPGPIPPESTLYPTCYSARLARPPPRIKPNAKDILEMGRKGTVGALLQLDGISFCQELMPKRRDHKDHEKENLRRMREIQRKCREKEQARELSQPKPVKALWKSQKYESVESKVKAKLQECPVPPNPEAQKFLRAYSRCGTGIHPRRSPSPNPARSRATAETSAAESPNGNVKIQEGGQAVDFVSHNAQNAKRAQLRRSRSLQSLSEVLEQKRKEQEDYNAKQKGHVPRYLIERKDYWRKEAEEHQRNMPDPAMPPGHAMMPESQRLETLTNLKQSQEQLLKDLLLLPVRADTLSVQNRHATLEKKLSQIEEALKIFSRPKVFIKLDS